MKAFTLTNEVFEDFVKVLELNGYGTNLARAIVHRAASTPEFDADPIAVDILSKAILNAVSQDIAI